MNKYICLFMLLVVILSCKRNLYDTAEKQIIPAQDVLKNFHINQINYDSLQIENASSMILETKSISKIVLTKKDSSNGIVLNSVIPEYAGENGNYSPGFTFYVEIDKDQLQFDFKLTFILFDSSIFEVDTMAIMCHYPYMSTEIYILNDNLPMHPNSKSAQDLDYYEGKFYYRPYGGFGIYEIDEASGDYRELIKYISSDFIAVDSSYLFYSTGFGSIVKMNLADNSFNQIFTYSYDTEIKGLEAEEGIIYMITRNYELQKYDYQGHTIESISYPKITLSLTKYENYLFSLRGGITRFNLSTNEFEHNLLAPSGDTQAIKFSSGYLFFADYERAYIGKVPIQDVLSYAN